MPTPENKNNLGPCHFGYFSHLYPATVANLRDTHAKRTSGKSCTLSFLLTSNLPKVSSKSSLERSSLGKNLISVPIWTATSNPLLFGNFSTNHSTAFGHVTRFLSFEKKKYLSLKVPRWYKRGGFQNEKPSCLLTLRPALIPILLLVIWIFLQLQMWLNLADGWQQFLHLKKREKRWKFRQIPTVGCWDTAFWSYTPPTLVHFNRFDPEPPKKSLFFIFVTFVIKNGS